MAVSAAYIAAATNRFNQAADISPSSNLIAFGSSQLIALWNLETLNDEGIFCTIPGNQSLITCIKFVNDECLITTNEGGVLSLWNSVHLSQWKNTVSVQAHMKSISTACVLNNCVVTASSDSLIKIWEINIGNENEIIEKQTLNLKGKLPIVVSLTSLPHSSALLLAVGGTDSKVQLWVRSEDQFVHSTTLSGHEDWIRSLAFRYPITDDEPLVLASGSQDATIRLWNIERRLKILRTAADDLVDDILDTFEASLGHLGENEEGGRQISLEHHILTVKSGPESSQQYSVTFDALLVGHEAGVTSLSWRPDALCTPTLLSTSTDSSLILWSPSAIDPTRDISLSIWVNRQRFGDVGGQRLGGFVGGLWGIHGTQALAWGWAGGWRRWQCGSSANDLADEIWTEVGAITGHSGHVKSLDWSPNGKYLASAGLDQTTRIHAPIRCTSGGSTSWHEIARPQVHGYDLLDVVFVNPLKFASIADEKVLRVFEAPRSFVELISKLEIAQFGDEHKSRPLAASVPPLGLSNKATDGPKDAVGEFDSSRRPFEGELSAITLWPETEKIFGHGYESITLGISNSRKIIATACKATNAEHAVIRVYDTDRYKLIGEPLEGHILTVTRISFSPDDKFILTVSRDRSWRLFEAQDDGAFKPVAVDKAHGRIIWDCAWSADGDVFATASRDKTVKIWHQNKDNWTAIATIKTQHPATAVAFTSEKQRKRRYLAVGLESGEILIYSNLTASQTKWQLEKTITSQVAHVEDVHQMAWRPLAANPHELASCSKDGTLRILKMHVILD